MKKTCYTLLVGLASLLAAGAQTTTPADPPPEATNAPAETLAATNAVTAPAAAPAATVEETTDTDTNSPAAAPVGQNIKFSDVPIRTAIENLARLASIN